MFTPIARDDAIFKSELFLQDVLAFSVMETILNDSIKYPTPKIFSNGKDCAIVNSDPEHAVIVWTADSFQEKAELYEFIKKEFAANTPLKIMSKKNFYDYLVENRQIPELSVQTLGVYTCPQLNDVQYIGHPDQAKAGEVEQIARMIVGFGHETEENPQAQLVDCMENAQKYTSDPNYLVWRDTNEKIVAIAHKRTGGTYARIGEVFTLPEARGKSYAKMLVHYLTSLSLKKGQGVMLFTNYDYAPSNRCYQAIGYQLTCTIVNFMPPLENE